MDINEWIDHISTPRSELGGMSVCPYVKKAKFELIETDGSDIRPPPWDFDLIIYILPDEYTIEDVTNIANEYNNIYPELVFLPDHRDRYTEINGVQTNNGTHNLILCQWRATLISAREKLQHTTYYQHWADDYLKEILGS